MNFIQRKKSQQPDGGETNSKKAENESPEKPIEEPAEAKTAVVKKSPAVYKFGIAQRLDDALENKQIWKGPKRSPDLVELSKKYDATRKLVRQMIMSARNYHKSLGEMGSARTTVCCSALTRKMSIF